MFSTEGGPHPARTVESFEESISVYEKREKSLIDSVRSLGEQKASLEKQNATLVSENQSQLKDSHKSLQSLTERSKWVEEKEEETKRRVYSLEADVEQVRRKLEVLTKLAADKMTTIEQLKNEEVPLRETLKEISAQIAVQNKALADTQERTRLEQRDVDALKKEREKLENDYGVRKAVIEKELSSAWDKLNKEKESVVLWVKWNEETRQKLVSYKTELENHYKRRFPEIVIGEPDLPELTK